MRLHIGDKLLVADDCGHCGNTSEAITEDCEYCMGLGFALDLIEDKVTTWHTNNWVRLGFELLRVLLAVLAGAGGAELSVPGQVATELHDQGVTP